MAHLKNCRTGQSLSISARWTVGRVAGNSLQLDDHRVSGQHAVIQWTGSQWEVRDLGSRNGTFVNDQRVSPGEPVALGAGDRVHFGVEELAWNAEDVGPPGVLACLLYTSDAADE